MTLVGQRPRKVDCAPTDILSVAVAAVAAWLSNHEVTVEFRISEPGR